MEGVVPKFEEVSHNLEYAQGHNIQNMYLGSISYASDVTRTRESSEISIMLLHLMGVDGAGTRAPAVSSLGCASIVNTSIYSGFKVHGESQ